MILFLGQPPIYVAHIYQLLAVYLQLMLLQQQERVHSTENHTPIYSVHVITLTLICISYSPSVVPVPHKRSRDFIQVYI